MTPILVLGGGGQLGRELVQALGADGLALTRAQLDVTQPVAVQRQLRELQPRVVINAAAYTAVDRAEQEAELAYAANRDAPGHLAAVCRELGAALLHVSTDYVFDGAKSSPYFEQDAVNPQGVYARSKCEGEQRVRAALPQHLILRTSWVFGVQGQNFVKTVLRLARERAELRIVSDQRGGPTPAAAVAAALADLALRALRAPLPWGTYHYAGAPACSWHAFAEAVVAEARALGLLQQNPPVCAIATHEYPTAARRPANSVLDCSAAQRHLGLHQPDWRDGLRAMLKNLQGNST